MWNFLHFFIEGRTMAREIWVKPFKGNFKGNSIIIVIKSNYVSRCGWFFQPIDFHDSTDFNLAR